MADPYCWKALPFSLTARRDTAGVVFGRQLLLLGGQSVQTDDSKDESSCDLSTVECLDLDLRRRWKYPDLNEARIGCVAATLQGRVVVAGGWNEVSGTLKSVEVWLPTKRKWVVSKTPTPIKRWMATAVTANHDNTLVIFGGRGKDGEVLKSVDLCDAGLFDGDSPVWESLAESMHQPRLGAAAVTLRSDKILVMGGFNGQEWVKQCEMLDFPSGNVREGTWKKMEHDMPQAVRFAHAVCVAYKNQEYVLIAGGNDQGSGTMLCYDALIGEWKWSREMDGPDFEGCFMSVVDSKLYVVGGCSTVYQSNQCAYWCTLDTEFYEKGPPDVLSSMPPAVPVQPPLSQYVNEQMPQMTDHEMMFKGQTCHYTGMTMKSSTIPNGVGRMVFSEAEGKEATEDNFYVGTFRDGLDDGIGEFTLKAHHWRYLGGFKKGKFSGYGLFQTIDMEYFGSFADGAMAGYGRATFHRDGRKLLYSGQWKSDHAHGRGTVVEYDSGNVLFNGAFEDGMAKAGNGIYKDFFTGEVLRKDQFKKNHKIAYD